MLDNVSQEEVSVDNQRYHRDGGKLRWSLVPVRAMRLVLTVFEFGARKYGARTYLQVPNARERYLESLYRHIEDVKEGVQSGGVSQLLCLDEESSMPHLAHAACDILILLDLSFTTGGEPCR